MEIKYYSELGRSFDTPEAAIEDDKRLLSIIATYEKDVQKMKAGMKYFGGELVTEQFIKSWQKHCDDYRELWEEAKLTHYAYEQHRSK